MPSESATSEKPRITDDPMFRLIRTMNPDEFNRRRESGEAVDLKNVDLRNIDLRLFDLRGLDLSNSYLRQADLRGQDLSECRMDGASLHSARISGTYFPQELSPEEIRLSCEFGTRLRHPTRA